MRVLVTGATGFIGRHVVNHLLTEDEVSLTTTSLSRRPISSFPPEVSHICCDLHSEHVDFYRHFNKPEVVIHLAWQGLPNYESCHHFAQNVPAYYQFLMNLIENGTQRILVTGSCLEYGLREGRQCEEMFALGDLTNYAFAKNALREMLTRSVANRPNVAFCWARLYYMYGPGQASTSLIPLLDRALREKRSHFAMSQGEQLRDYLHVSEVAAKLVALSKSPKAKGTVNVCSGTPISVRRFVEEYLENRGAEIHLDLGRYPYPSYEPMGFWGDTTRMTSILNDSR